MKSIIVATDFSPNAFNAALYAAEMAQHTNGYIILLHVCASPMVPTEVPVIVDQATIVADSEKFMAEHARKLIHASREQVIFETLVTSGNFLTALRSACKRWKPYAVVMGCQGTSEAERFLFGSHVINSMRHLEWPVIAVPPQAKFSAVKKIGFAAEFSDVADATPVDELEVLVRTFKAQLHVLNIYDRPSQNSSVVTDSHRLYHFLEKLSPVFHFIAHKNTDDGIIEFAEKNDIDLLVVLPRRHSLVEKMLVKSHTRQLVLHSHVPVMSLHTA